MWCGLPSHPCHAICLLPYCIAVSSLFPIGSQRKKKKPIPIPFHILSHLPNDKRWIWISKYRILPSENLENCFNLRMLVNLISLFKIVYFHYIPTILILWGGEKWKTADISFTSSSLCFDLWPLCMFPAAQLFCSLTYLDHLCFGHLLWKVFIESFHPHLLISANL